MKVNIRKFRSGAGERRIDIQVEPWDTYSVDHTASLIILPLLLQLKESQHGVPNEFVQRIGGDFDDNYCFDFIKDDDNDIFEQGCQKWHETVDKMIWSFQQLVMDDYDSKYHHGQMQVGWKPVEVPHPTTGVVEKMYEMIDENPNEHWYDYVGHQLHEERIQEGLELFGKHFRSLWD
jgi:hypothetical protein